MLSFDEYQKFGALSVDFSLTGFLYTSSQYAKFSRAILADGFAIESESESTPGLPADEVQTSP